jgi:hypothetical protein
MFCIDTRLEVVDHPIIGKTCISNCSISRHERFYYWGVYEKASNVDDTTNESDFKLNVSDNAYTIDPAYDCHIRFCNAPGPNETSNIEPTKRYFFSEDRRLLAQEFKATRNILMGTQLVWRYGGDGWFKDRNITRINICTESLPVPKKKRRRM